MTLNYLLFHSFLQKVLFDLIISTRENYFREFGCVYLMLFLVRMEVFILIGFKDPLCNSGLKTLFYNYFPKVLPKLDRMTYVNI